MSWVCNTGALASHCSSSADLEALNCARLPRCSRCAKVSPGCAAWGVRVKVVDHCSPGASRSE